MAWCTGQVAVLARPYLAAQHLQLYTSSGELDIPSLDLRSCLNHHRCQEADVAVHGDMAAGCLQSAFSLPLWQIDATAKAGPAQLRAYSLMV